MEKYIVAEITKNWDANSFVPISNLISQQFENVINVNAKRGYKLIDWKFSAINNGSVHTETIVAIFEAVEQQAQETDFIAMADRILEQRNNLAKREGA